MDQVLLQYGAIGVVALLALGAVRMLFTKMVEANKRETERGDRLEKELTDLNKAVRDQYLSTIGDATKAIADALAAVRKR
jgi:hypothetical protein